MLSTMKKGLGVLATAAVLSLVGASAVHADPAVKVTKVKPNSPADDAGVVSGDVILEIDDTPIHSKTTLAQAIQDSGGDATLLVRHADGSTDVLEAFPDPTLGVQVKVVQLPNGGPVFFKKTLNGGKGPGKPLPGKKKKVQP